MRARMLMVVAGLIGGLGWMAKLVIMAAQDGPDAESTLESIAFFVGLLGVIVASIAGGVYLASARSSGWRVLAGLAGFVVVGVVIGLGQVLLTALPGDSWVQEEAIFGVVGLFAVVVAATALLRPTDADGEAAATTSPRR